MEQPHPQFTCWQTDRTLCSVVSNSATPCTVAHQAPLSMGLSRQEYWSRLPFPSPGDLSNEGTEPRSPALQVDSSSSKPPGKPCWILGLMSAWAGLIRVSRQRGQVPAIREIQGTPEIHPGSIPYSLWTPVLSQAMWASNYHPQDYYEG